MTKTEAMVKNLADNLQKDGISILKAKCSGYDEPINIAGVMPDIIGWDPDKEIYHLGIVVDSYSMNSDSTNQKILTLSKLMMREGTSEGKRLPFSIGVPQEASAIVDKKLAECDDISRENTQKIII